MRHEDITPKERLDEIAGILARGVQRLHSRAGLATKTNPENLQESAETVLDVSAKTVLSGPKS